MTRKAPIQIDFNTSGIGLDIYYASIPWCEHERIFNEFYAPRYGKSQSAERIAERGGFGVKEAVELGYDNSLLIWVAGKKYPDNDSDWVKLGLQFNLEAKTFRYRVFTEEEYQSLDLFERIKNDYDKEVCEAAINYCLENSV